MRKWAALALMALCAVGAGFGQTAGGARQACAQIGKLNLARTEIAQAAVVEAGVLDLGQKHPDAIFKKLPAFCRVVAIVRPTADSNIKVEIWLPLAGWNGKFIGQGNGGFAGSIDYRGLAAAVLSGFSSGGTDTGHTGGGTDSDWALGHPEKVIDFGWRGVHSMTGLSKTVVQAFYSSTAQHNYFTSCSDGGREALMEAQRFPGDYDGILAGAPAYNWTSLISRAAQMTQQLLARPESYLPASKVPAIYKAVLASCHKDEPGEFLADPRSCHFSPDTLVCKGAETDACLTQAQANSVKALYASSYLTDGTLVYHGLLPGAELGDNGWQGWITGSAPRKSAGTAYTEGYFRNLVYSNPNWDLNSFNLDRDLKVAQAKTAAALDAVNPDLTAFRARGGKLILYHGWDDAAISPLATIDYFNSVEQKVGQQETDGFVRLFLVPGMQHCGGGPGPADFGQFGPTFKPLLDDTEHNITTALEEWVEKGRVPEQVIARGNTNTTGAGKGVSFTEPICAYPKAAVYKGSGDRKDAASYACVAK
ncbi:MAG TPA: tannase/feruloyl esterase family alpha/beta hydrolase [Terracidiphilus sp.]|jgi:feruloyl esterase